MIFLGTQFWKEEVPVYPLIQYLAEKEKYKNLYLDLTDDSEVVMKDLIDFQCEVKTHPEKFNLT